MAVSSSDQLQVILVPMEDQVGALTNDQDLADTIGSAVDGIFNHMISVGGNRLDYGHWSKLSSRPATIK